MAWAKRKDLYCLDLGGRLNPKPGYTTVDLHDADININLNMKWDMPDNSVGVIRAYDVIEHLDSPIHIMEEIQRVLVPGGYALIQVPSTDGRGAFQDPLHKTFWNENSFLYYTNSCFSKYINTPVRFQAMKLITTEFDINKVCWVNAHLVNLKQGYRPPGLINI